MNIPISTIGQDSHRFTEDTKKPLILAGVIVENERGLLANSDGDVVFHAITNAVSSLTSVNILGPIADDLCINKGIKDSSIYLKEALKYLDGSLICHVSLTIECNQPKINPIIPDMKKNIAKILNLTTKDIGITATTGEGLTSFGRGRGIQVICIISAIKKIPR